MRTPYHPVSPIAELLTVVAKRWRMKRRPPLALLPELWPQLVGPGVARHAAPLAMSRGELTLAVDSAVWMSELRYQLPTILARLNEALGKGKVKSLRLVQSPLPMNSAPPPVAKAPVAELKASPEEQRKALELAATVSEPELGETFKRAYLHACRLHSEKERSEGG